MKPIPIYVGLDPVAEPVAYHVFCQSVIDHSSVPVAFIPLDLRLLKRVGYEQEGTRDGSNQFIYSRFLVPYLNDYRGKALFFDGDMLCRYDIAELMDLCDERTAVQVVQHSYKTKHPVKYLGAKNEDYPRKNWSSVILWNCNHWQNRKLTPKFVMESSGSELHRFTWLEDRFIGSLPLEWNYLEGEYEDSPNAKLVHHTIGTPCFNADKNYDYKNSPFAAEWYETYQRMIYPLKGDGWASHL